MKKHIDPTELAERFLNLDPAGFREFWSHIQYVWNIEDCGADLEAEWFLFGKEIRNNDTVISAMLGAVRSGKKSALTKPDKNPPPE